MVVLKEMEDAERALTRKQLESDSHRKCKSGLGKATAPARQPEFLRDECEFWKRMGTGLNYNKGRWKKYFAFLSPHCGKRDCTYMKRPYQGGLWRKNKGTLWYCLRCINVECKALAARAHDFVPTGKARYVYESDVPNFFHEYKDLSLLDGFVLFCEEHGNDTKGERYHSRQVK